LHCGRAVVGQIGFSEHVVHRHWRPSERGLEA
jgi:hypothetical protein